MYGYSPPYLSRAEGLVRCELDASKQTWAQLSAASVANRLRGDGGDAEGTRTVRKWGAVVRGPPLQGPHLLSNVVGVAMGAAVEAEWRSTGVAPGE